MVGRHVDHDATPAPCGTSRETVKRSVLAGHAGYGYCASYSRFYWGYRNGNLGVVRQWIESVNQTLKGQLDLEQHGGRTTHGVFTRVAQRLLAMAAEIWRNWATGVQAKRSLTAYDH